MTYDQWKTTPPEERWGSGYREEEEMSMFLCARCDEMRDADDGCAEAPNNGLYCIDCMNEMEDADNRTRHTYDEIYDTLIKAGCPSDIADELAREKSR